MTKKVFCLVIVVSLMIFGTAYAQDVAVHRLEGADRYETAVKISQKGWQSADTVILARGDNFPDALASTPLSFIYDAPVLLTYPGKLHPLTEQEISRLQADRVIILGGLKAVSKNVVDSLELMGKTVERYGGEDRFETAVEIAKAMNHGKTAIVTTGVTFQDALVIAPYAGRAGIPILLTRKDTLPESTRKYLEEAGVTETIVVGSTLAISSSVMQQLPQPKRVSGTTASATAVAVSQNYLPEATHFYVSRSDLFPDALAGAALAAKTKGAILLTASRALDQATRLFLEAKKDAVTETVLLGGPVAVSSTVENQVLNIIAPFLKKLLTKVDIYNLVSPAVVHLETNRGSTGSGFIIESGGLILTNYHVIEGATRIWVTLADNRKLEASLLVNYDAVTDLALIKIDLDNLPVVPLGDSGLLQAGQDIVAIGNPLGFTQSITSGVVSFPVRSFEGLGKVMQISITISPGNSGGPILNMYGEAVGVGTAKMTFQSQNIGFAKPINEATALLQKTPLNIALTKSGRATPNQISDILFQEYSTTSIHSYLLWFSSIHIYEVNDYVSILIRLDDKSIDSWLDAVYDGYWEEIEDWLLTITERAKQEYPDSDITLRVYFYDFYSFSPTWGPDNSEILYKGNGWYSLSFNLVDYSSDSGNFKWLP
jgi:S1-C subfamily serine protease